MSAAEGWEITVPADDAELLAELRRHGVRAGQRLRIVEAITPTTSEPSGESMTRHRTLGWAAMGQTTKNVSEDVEAHLSGFGR